MTYDYILMNPPYNVGNKITSAAISSCDKCVCLMPLAQYKPKTAELWRNVESFELADNEMFEDADITKNLCICTLKNRNVDKYSWEDMQFESFDKRYIEFYKRNKELTMKYHIKEIRFKRCDNANVKDYNKDLDFFESNRLCDGVTGGGGFGKGGSGWKWNYEGDENLGAGLATIHFDTLQAKDNFCSWWYFKKKGEGLASMLQIGLGLKTVSATCSIAIPQIDWETISDTPLWKEGKYDEAVLSEMNLHWNEDKTGVVEMGLISEYKKEKI